MHPPGKLLAVDLGLRTGWAVYATTGRLLRYGSTNLGSRQRLKRAAPGLLADHTPIAWVVVEGDSGLAHTWERAAERVDARVVAVAAERWRAALLHPSERRDGPSAKRSAGRLAHAVIAWSGAPRPAAGLRHDTAEAICIGLWGTVAVGWLDRLPRELSLAARGA